MFTFRQQTFRCMKSCSSRSFSSIMTNLFRKENIPYYGLAVGSFALGFQAFVLHPWHDKLSEKFDQLDKEINELDKVSAELTKKMEQVVAIGREVKEKERENVHRSQEILTKLEKTKEQMELIQQPTSAMD